MTKTRISTDITKQATLHLLKHGLVSQAEAAILAGISRQLLHHWCRDINVHKARNHYLRQQWAKALRSQRGGSNSQPSPYKGAATAV